MKTPRELANELEALLNKHYRNVGFTADFSSYTWAVPSHSGLYLSAVEDADCMDAYQFVSFSCVEGEIDPESYNRHTAYSAARLMGVVL